MNGFSWGIRLLAIAVLTAGVPAVAATAGGGGLPVETMAWRSYFVPQAGRAYHCAIQLYDDNASALMIGGYGAPGIFTLSAPSKSSNSAAVSVGGDAWTSLNGWQWIRAGYPNGDTSRLYAGLVELNSQLF